MAVVQRSLHPSIPEIVAFLHRTVKKGNGAWSKFAIKSHLSTCDECATQADRLNRSSSGSGASTNGAPAHN